MSTAFVSGANGFISQHLIKLLIENNYQVIGSVRTEAKGESLKKNFPKNFEYVVVADIGKVGAFDEALQKHPEINVFFHTASPFHFLNENIEENLLYPAINGTRNALTSAKKYGKNLKRFVVTSSFAAIGYTRLANPDHPVDVDNEDSWSDFSWEVGKTSGLHGYVLSKVLGEKEAWKFQKEENPQFEVTSVNPVFAFGPQAFEPEANDPLNTTIEGINQFLNLKPNDELPTYRGYSVDIRDVAKAHLIAAEKKEASNQRIIVKNDIFSEQRIVNLILEKFPQLKGTISAGNPSNVEQTLKEAALSEVDDSRSKKLLGFEQIGFEKSIVDTVSELLKAKN